MVYSLKNKATGFFWVSFTLLGSNVYVFRTILGPFILGAMLGYLFHPLATKLTDFRIKRALTSALVMILFFVMLFGFLFYFTPFLEERLMYIISQLPDLHAKLKELTRPFLTADPALYGELNSVFPTNEALHKIAHEISHWAMHFFLSVVSGARSVEVLVFYIIVAPIVAFDCLRDWPLLLRFFKATTPALAEESLNQFWRDLDSIMKRCIRRHIFLCWTLALYYMAALHFCRVPYATTLSFLTALLLMVPSLGLLIAFVLVFSIGLSYKPDLHMALHIIVVYVVGYGLSAFALKPYFLKDGLGLHPLWIFFTIFASTFLIGAVGAFFALPLAGLSYAALKWFVASYQRTKAHAKQQELAPSVP